jgi:hypothetical protein
MKLDHEATSIVVVMTLYLTIHVEVMLWTEKYYFLCTSYKFKLLKKQ